MKSKKKFAFVKKAVAVFCALVLCLPLSACNTSAKAFEKQDFLMDTVLIQKIYAQKGAEQISQKVFKSLSESEKRLSAFDENSELYKINQSAGAPVSASQQTVAFIKESLELSKDGDSEDSFDISVFPLSFLWKNAISLNKLPSESEIRSAAALVDDKKIVIDTQNNTVTLPAGMGLDLGALAKGAALKDARAIYEQNNVTGAICSLGSSAMLLYGTKPDGSNFKIGLRDPFGDASEQFATISLSDCIISTSGGYERYAEIDGKKYHHIIDPKTGYPADTDVASVTVVGKDGALCDFLSTKLFMCGFDSAVRTAQQQNLSVVLVSNSKKVFISENLAESFELKGAEYERVGIE